MIAGEKVLSLPSRCLFDGFSSFALSSMAGPWNAETDNVVSRTHRALLPTQAKDPAFVWALGRGMADTSYDGEENRFAHK